ncbi:MAG: TonB family protein [Acidobacteriota bacterium]
MNRHVLSVALTAAAVCLPAVAGRASLLSGAPQGAVAPVKLTQPVYPPIAASARVSGVVEITVAVRPDGGVESAVIVGGPPLLQQAALQAARTSQFECRDCSGAATPYSLVFAFLLERPVEPTAGSAPRDTLNETASQSRVTIVAEAPIIIPYFSSIRVRSAKCLYLWSCGSRWGGYGYYGYVPVRSPRCLWLWTCSFGRR